MKMQSTLTPALLAAVAGLSLAATAGAAEISLIGSDAFGTSSFNSGQHWADSAAPSAGNTYITNDFRMRTPADGESYTFGGDSLTVNNTNALEGGLMYKGTGNTGVLTINNLILDGGRIHHQNGTGDLFQLAGNISVVSDSSIHAKQGNIDISAPISGSANLAIPATDAPDEDARYVTLLADNSGFSGNIDVAGQFALGTTGALTFDIGAAGVNNAITGTGGNVVLDGTFNFDLSGAGTTDGDSWQIVSAATLGSLAYGETFNVAGFTEAADVWTSGNYVFTESTGVLAVVVPEPTSLALVGLGGLTLLRRRR